MTLDEQIERRLDLASRIGRQPVRWIATRAVASAIAPGARLHGLPVGIGTPRSDWGLELVCERSA